MESDFIKNLKLDHWSTIILAFGLVLIVTSLKTELHVVTNLDLLVIAVGVSMLGLGEKFNHEWITVTIPANIYTTGGNALQGEGYLRKMTFLGIVLDLAGVSLIAYRLYKIMQYS